MKKTILFLFYILLPLYWTKRLFSQKFWQELSRINEGFNNDRGTYNPKDYKGGENFESEEDRTEHLEGFYLKKFLEQNQPKSVLEIGPGAGFYTRQIVDFPSVDRYRSIEINTVFSSYLSEIVQRENLSATHVTGDYKQVDWADWDCDTIFVIETLHHMHDRTEFILKALAELKNLKHIISYEPTHYLPRIGRLLRKTPKYIKNKSYQLDRAWGTHHFLTIGEFKSIKKKHPNIKITFTPTFGKRLKPIATILQAIEGILPFARRYYPLSRFFMTSIYIQIDI
ncbi:MAG: class I SAM-dependent methyltransferase [Candidatus Puniceispirillaceae bacterium]